MSTSTEVGHGQPDRSFFGHPRGLVNLFGTEMWERFSFYGMQAILTIYLYYEVADGGLGLPRDSATSVVGAYGGLVYLSTIVGAWVADRLLGRQRTLFYSAILIMFGHISLALLPGLAGVGVGLAAVGLGAGGLKGNATSLVGSLYAKEDERRDAAFSIFYLGINLGAFLGQILTGLVQEEVGFHYGFGLAALGMAIGLVQYTLGRKNLSADADVVANPLPAAQRPLAVGGALAVVAAIVLLVMTGAITPANLADVTLVVIIVAVLAYFTVILTSRKITTVERKRVFSFIPMFLASFVFFSLFQQQYTLVIIYADKRIDRGIFGWEMPVAWANSFNPVFIILLAGVFAAMWTKLGSRQPSTPIKFALGTITIGIAYLVFLLFAGGTGNSTPLLILVLIMLIFTVGELMLSPVGLSLSTKLAPEAFRTQMVALNFLSIALGSTMAGWLAGYYSVDNEAPYFALVGGASIAFGLLLVLLTPFIKKLMSGVR
ncbi:peptide MFS transporter [Amycolatopsis aidingensis]|uniref:peptide MFS transporter n=1 Tax=Amycolatopsis aidingensis TaxID=2842453 RepID=UPI001C0B6012|nr:peptide MFS transporter [Amycolatopsis aidingensis]